MDKKLIDYEGFEAYSQGVRDKYAIKKDIITPQERKQLQLHNEGYIQSFVEDISSLLYCLFINTAFFLREKRNGFFSFIDDLVFNADGTVKDKTELDKITKLELVKKYQQHAISKTYGVIIDKDSNNIGVDKLTDMSLKVYIPSHVFDVLWSEYDANQSMGFAFRSFVAKEKGKSLSTNDYTDEEKLKVGRIPNNPKYTDTIPDLSEYATKSELNKKIDKSSISDNFTEQSKDKILSQKGACELGMQLSIKIENATKTKAEKSDIPTSLSQLTNDKTFKTESEIQSMIEKASSLKKEVVASLPTTGKDDVIYLVKDSKGKDNNNYLEYLWLNGKYELIGSTQVDLSGYAKLDDIVASKIIDTYVLNKDFATALIDDQDFLKAIKRDMFTLVIFEESQRNELMEKAGFESILYYKGGVCGICLLPTDDYLEDTFVKQNKLFKSQTYITSNFMSNYNKVIQEQFVELQSSLKQYVKNCLNRKLNVADIREFTQQELEEAFR